MANPFVELHPDDDVWIALKGMPAGSVAPLEGVRTKSELLGYGEEEFSPWDLGLML